VTLDQPDQDVGSQWQWLAGSGGPTCPFQGRFDVHLGRDPRPADEVDTMCLSRVGMGTQHLPICPRRPPRHGVPLTVCQLASLRSIRALGPPHCFGS